MQTLLKDKAYVVLFICSILASVLNYVFQIMLGNMLTVDEFGVFNTINALTTNVVMIYTPLSIYCCRITSQNRDEISKNKNIFEQIFQVSILISGVFIFGGAIMYPFFMGRYGASSLGRWIFLLAMIVIAGLYNIVNGVLQGSTDFAVYGVLSIVVVGIKLICCYLLVKRGIGIQGIVFSMLISFGLTMMMMVFFLKGRWKPTENYLERVEWKCLISEYGLTFGVQLLSSFFINGGEVILMGYFYSDNDIGIYSSVAVLAKVAIYVVSVVSVVLLPNVAKESSKGKSVKKLLMISLLVCTLVSCMYAIFLKIFGDRLVLFLFGNKYSGGLQFINRLALYSVTLAIILVLNSIFLGVNRPKYYFLLLLVAFVMCLAFVKIFLPPISMIPIVFGIILCGVIGMSILYFIKADL